MPMRILSPSRLGTFRDCPRKYQIKYIDDYIPVRESDALRFGKVFHTALEKLWANDMASAVAWLSGQAGNIEDADAARITALLKNYRPPIEPGMEVLGVEVPFEIPIVHPETRDTRYGYRICGFVDLILGDPESGQVWVVDHKTTAADIVGFGPYWQALQIDFQMGIYSLAWGASAFVYDVIRKPTIRPSAKDEKEADGGNVIDAYQARIEADIEVDPAKYFQWRVHPRTEDDMRDTMRDLWDQTQILDYCYQHDLWPRNSNACVGRYGACEYLEACAGRADLDDEALFCHRYSDREKPAQVVTNTFVDESARRFLDLTEEETAAIDAAPTPAECPEPQSHIDRAWQDKAAKKIREEIGLGSILHEDAKNIYHAAAEEAGVKSRLTKSWLLKNGFLPHKDEHGANVIEVAAEEWAVTEEE